MPTAKNANLYGHVQTLGQQEQKLLDHAKDILMRQLNLNAEQAYVLLSEMAEKRKTSILDVSQQLVTLTQKLTV